eukprot:13991570-Alexandrium_andersonii.AAC.1
MGDNVVVVVLVPTDEPGLSICPFPPRFAPLPGYRTRQTVHDTVARAERSYAEEERCASAPEAVPSPATDSS